jgi:phosphoribosylaminoimidazole-succinocarboxamide synthase
MMIEEMDVKEQLNNTLKETDFKGLGRLERGKVRDIYFADSRLTLIASDRISAFDVVVGTIPFKGQVLTQVAAFWFEMTKDIVSNHVLSVPDPNVTIVQRCEPLPVEVVVRAYLTGSAWRDYEKGKDISGIKLPSGMKRNQRFEKPIITPSTKADKGEHDMPISSEEIVKQELVSADDWKDIERISLEIFERGTTISAKNGLILVDTKYEFGKLDGRIILMDEIHTPDSSRYWHADSYEKLFEEGNDQKGLDKEHVRDWLRENGFSGDGEPPELSEEIRVEAAKRYIKVYEQLTGRELKLMKVPILHRIEVNLKEAGHLDDESDESEEISI